MKLQPFSLTPPSYPLDKVPILKAEHVTHTYTPSGEPVTAVADVSLQLYPGEMVLLMGPAGSGKSTLLAILSGLLRPTSGTVVAAGNDLAKLSTVQLETFRMQHCGFIFQEYNLLPALNARQQLELVLRWGGGVSAHDARLHADDMLQRLDLAKKGTLMPSQLSGGEQQRVAVGRGLVKKPTFCFADEPTAALDWKRGQQVIELLHNAARESGVCVLIAAHDERIIPHADRVLTMEDGRLHEASEVELRKIRVEGSLAAQN